MDKMPNGMRGAEPGRRRLTPEFRLLVTAARCGIGEPLDDEVAALLAAGIDSGRFLELVDRHRLAPLVWRALRRVPVAAQGDCADPTLFDALATRAKANAFTALLQASELRILQAGMRARGVDCLFFKGPVLALQAYGDLALRHAGDLDLLVDPDDMAAAMAVATAAGYQRERPEFDLTPRQWRAYQAAMSDYGYRHPGHGLLLELHWRTFNNPYFLPLTRRQLLAAGEELTIGATVIPAMGWSEQVLYLSAHGARHAWFRLFWLLDIHVLLRARPIDHQRGLLDRAVELGVERVLLLALVLARRVFGASLDSVIECAVARNPVVTELVATVTTAMHGPAGLWADQQGRTLRQGLGQLRYFAMLRRGGRYRWNILTAGLVNPADWQRLRLPDRLFFLYWPLRPILRLLRRNA